jgi:anti-sigma factor RsiW
MKLKEVELTNYVDGTLDASRQKAVEEQLRLQPEAAEAVAQQAMIRDLLQQSETEDPLPPVDIWPRVRERLPAQPGNGWLRSLGSRAGGWLWPTYSPLRISVRVAVLAVVLAMMVSMFQPRQAVNSLSAQEQQFIQQSLDQHAAYVASQPLSGGVPATGNEARGDVSSADDGADDETTNAKVP